MHLPLGDWIHRFIGRLSGVKNDGRLRCVKCGQELTGLSVNARCPCGEAVFSSVMRSVPAVPDDAENANDHPSRKPFAFVRSETGYPVDAYLFIADVLLRLRRRAAEQHGLTFSNTRFVSAEELVAGLRQFALEFFGEPGEAGEVLRSWNVLSSEDIGKIVQRLVDAGLLAAGAHDSPEKFNGLFTLEGFFSEPGAAS